jgi:hypothetical protein
VRLPTREQLVYIHLTLMRSIVSPRLVGKTLLLSPSTLSIIFDPTVVAQCGMSGSGWALSTVLATL